MYVEKILPAARERLVTLAENAPLVQAAKCLSGPDVPLVVVADGQGAVRGVISKTDVVRRISSCTGASCTRAVATVMTREIASCNPGETLRDVWEVMKTRKLKHMPVIDSDGRALGVLSARTVMQALVEETQMEEELMRDYITCIGYR